MHDTTNVAPRESRRAALGPGLQSRLARRFFVVFVGCALVPVLVLATVAYARVGSEIEALAGQRLAGATRTLGAALFDRLQLTPGTPIELDSAGLAAWTLSNPDWSGRGGVGAAGATDRVLAWIPDPTGADILRGTADSAGSRPQWRQLDTDAIWTALYDATPEGTSLCVLDAARHPLYCPEGTDRAVAVAGALPPERTGSADTWTDDAGTYLGAGREVFLRYAFGGDSWFLVLTQDRDAAWVPLRSFRAAFPAIMLLTLLVVVLATSVQIRRTTGPLAQIVAGMRRVAQRDFSSPVPVTGDNEFGIVAEHFNDMAATLHDQFETVTHLNRELEVASKSLLDQRARLAAVFDGVADGIFSLDAQGRLDQVNEAFGRMFGYVESGVSGHAIEATIPGAWSLLSNHPDGEITSIQLEGVRRDGSRFPVELSIRGANVAGVPAYLGVVRDVTERVEAERERERLSEQLRQAQRLETMGTLAGGIAHDFNNILAPILGYVDMALMDVPEDTELHEDMQHVRKAATRAKSLVRQMLTFSRRVEKDQAPVDLSDVVREALGLIRSSLPSTIEIVERLPASGPVVFADATQMHQVVMNLCTNAGHAMRREGGTLTVDITVGDPSAAEPGLPPGSFAILTISDTGHGMDAEIRARLFEPFYTTKGQEGTGLGMSVVHGIVTDHDGIILVDSTPGEGSTFRVLLPIPTDSATDHEPEVSRTHDRRAVERVLLVDDEQAVLSVMAKMLTRAGYEVTATTDARDALQIVTHDPDAFHAVITDYTMPHLSGPELAEQIWERRPEMPMLLVTGYAVDLQVIGSLGFRGCILKPVSATELASAVGQAIGAGAGASTGS